VTTLRQWINLVERAAAPSITETPEFKRWFSGSKVVDAHGKPLVVYHGTLENFGHFKLDSERRRAYGTNRLGFWFDTNPKTPSYFAGYMGHADPEHDRITPGGNVMPCYLSIKRPLVFNSEPVWIEDQKALDAHASSRNWSAYNRHVEQMDRADAYDRLLRAISGGRRVKQSSREWEAMVEEFREQAISEGYDGILLKDTFADAGTRGGGLTDWWIAFYPHQIKSAIANKGTFSPDSPEITEGLA